MRIFLISIFLFVPLWIIFATFQWPTGKIRVYTLLAVEDPKPAHWPSYSNLGKTTYKLHDEAVTEYSSKYKNVYQDCFILNKKNWQCFREEKKSKFGMVEGKYFDIWLAESVGTWETKYVSEREYHLNGCAWDFASGGLQLISCALRPFGNSY